MKRKMVGKKTWMHIDLNRWNEATFTRVASGNFMFRFFGGAPQHSERILKNWFQKKYSWIQLGMPRGTQGTRSQRSPAVFHFPISRGLVENQVLTHWNLIKLCRSTDLIFFSLMGNILKQPQSSNANSRF